MSSDETVCVDAKGDRVRAGDVVQSLTGWTCPFVACSKQRVTWKDVDWRPDGAHCSACGGELVGEYDRGLVVSISDPDADFDYELNRYRGINPTMHVAFKDRDGETEYEEDFSSHSTQTGPWDDVKYQFEEIELAEVRVGRQEP
jgi:hypothetical protein